MMSSVELAFRINSCVGEGPLWDDRSQTLFWIDVLEGKVFNFNPITQKNAEIEIGKHVGAIALTDANEIVAAARDEIVSVDLSNSSITSLIRVINNERFRFNDGRVDAKSRFVVGSMGYEPKLGTAALYSITLPKKIDTVLENVGLSNGLCWSQDNNKFFYIDTLTSQIAEYSYDLETGQVSNRRTVITFETSLGSPDGMTIDCEGNLWVAFWGGGCVRRISPMGQIISEIPLPVSRVTSAAFGGENFNRLFITTASYLLSEQELAREPLAGSLFVLETDTQGFPEHRIKLHQ
jgi:sugar lactone lactonase YvrE